MNRLRRVATLVGSATIMLCAACGTSTDAGMSLGTDPGTDTGTVSVGTASASPSSTSTDGRKPCSHPTAMSGFLKLESAAATQDGTSLNVTFVSCTVDPVDDENVDYTPTAAAAAQVLVRAGADIQVLLPDDTKQTVGAGWLVGHQVVNSPYFYYQDDAQHEITAMQEIYHP